MQNQTTQIRVTLPIQLQGLLQAKTSKFGLSLSAYIRNLIINDVQDVKYPMYEMSDKSISDLKEAKQEEKAENLVKTNNVGDFLNNL